jgi:hypothetical protein
VIQSRFYNIAGARWEARFFQKGECFPDTDRTVPKQGIWASLAGSGWDLPCFVGYSWKSVRLDPGVLYFPEKK